MADVCFCWYTIQMIKLSNIVRQDKSENESMQEKRCLFLSVRSKEKKCDFTIFVSVVTIPCLLTKGGSNGTL